AELLPGGLEPWGQLVHERPRGLLRGFRCACDLLAVLVGAGQKERGIAGLTVKAGQRVRQDLLVGMAQMRQTIDVIDGGRDVETLWHGSPGREEERDYSESRKSPFPPPSGPPSASGPSPEPSARGEPPFPRLPQLQSPHCLYGPGGISS